MTCPVPDPHDDLVLFAFAGPDGSVYFEPGWCVAIEVQGYCAESAFTFGHVECDPEELVRALAHEIRVEDLAVPPAPDESGLWVLDVHTEWHVTNLVPRRVRVESTCAWRRPTRDDGWRTLSGLDVEGLGCCGARGPHQVGRPWLRDPDLRNLEAI